MIKKTLKRDRTDLRNLSKVALLILLGSINGFGQSLGFQATDAPIMDTTEKAAQFPGGNHQVYAYFKSVRIYPDEALTNMKTGKVYVAFTVDTMGKVKNPEIVKSLDPPLDKEAIKIISSMPDWTPAEKDGEKIESHHVLYIFFSPKQHKNQ